MQGIEAQAGVDVDVDGEIDEWTDWQEVAEEYFQIEGYSKAFGLEEATCDTSSLPAGYGVAFRFRSELGNVVFDSIQISSVPAPSDTLFGDVNLDGFVNFFDISPFIALLSSGLYLEEADMNQDETVDFFDISPFIAALSQ